MQKNILREKEREFIGELKNVSVKLKFYFFRDICDIEFYRTAKRSYFQVGFITV